MADPNDSDGSWEFVDKDTDSETSSVALPYDTGLPDESSQNDDIVGSAWNNNEDFITDSDIEACTEDPVESDEEEDATLVQAAAQMSGSEYEDRRSVGEFENESTSSSGTLTKSMLMYEKDNLPELEEPTNPLEKDSAPDEDQPHEKADNALLSCSDGVSTQEVTSQDVINASLMDDIIPPPRLISDQVPEIEEAESLPASSSESDFERIAAPPDPTNSDPDFEPGVVETIGNANDTENETTVVKTVEDAPPSDESDAGSVDFTVISAPSSPPVEIVSHQTETIETDEDISSNQRSVGMVTELMPFNPEMVDKATAPANQRTVGMVTDYISPPNQRLLISIIMISFGIGFLLGRCPLPNPAAFYEYKDHYAQIEKTDFQETPISVQHIYHGDNSQPVDFESTAIKILQRSLTRSQMYDTLARNKIVAENSKLRNQNRGLRSTIRKLREKNDEILEEQSTKQSTAAEEARMALNILQQSCHRQQQLLEMRMEDKDKELKQLKTNVEVADRDNVFLNKSMALYKRLQAQYTALMRLYEDAAESHALEKEKSVERYEGVKLRLRRYRMESKKLIKELSRAKSRNLYLELLVEQNDVLRQSESTKKPILDSGNLSPFLQALHGHDRMCHLKSKFKTQVKFLRGKVKGQTSLIRKLEQEGHLKSMALEILYNSVGELSNYATCLKKQFQLQPLERASNVPAFCRSTPRATPHYFADSSPKFGPRCFYPINGTLALDFTSMNITVEGFSENIPSYEIKLLANSVRPNLFFNATPMFTNSTSTCDVTLKANLTSDLQQKFVPKSLYAQVVKRNVRTCSKLQAKKAEYAKLRRTCAASNRSLEVSRKRVEKMENLLMLAKTELKDLRLERKDLNKKLRNATNELKKKSSLKKCFESALDAEQLLQKINGTKAYKGASKMAAKVKKATKKAWNKMKKFMSKFAVKKRHRDYDDEWNDDDDNAEKVHEDKRNHHEVDNKQDDDDDETDKDRSWTSGKFHKNHQKWKKSEERFFSQKPKYPENSNKYKNDEKKEKYDDQNQENYYFNHQYKKKLRKEGRKMTENFESGTGDRKQWKSRQNGQKKGKRSQFLHAVVSKHVDMAKKAGKKVFHHLMPIYDKWQKVYCNIEKKILPKSFTEIWESLGKDDPTAIQGDLRNKRPKSFTEIWESVREEDSTVTQDKTDIIQDEVENQGQNWGWSLYQNFTEFFIPIIELPGKMELPAWGVDGDKTQWVATTTRRGSSNEDKKLVGPPEEKRSENENAETQEAAKSKDALWFARMFQAREDLRKDSGDSPLSEEEFDWFLQMFHAREKLRRSSDDAYPGYHGNDDEMDWFLKMFEARARLRFKGTEDEKNWYLKMSEARKRARSEVKEQGTNKIDWYQRMFKARENFRDKHDDAEWYHKMAEERKKERWSKKNDGPKENQCQL